MLGLFSTIDEDILIRRLLKYGLFPENLSRIFSSKKFGIWAFSNGIRLFKEQSFSTIKYRLTRNNNAPRILEIPHPIGYYYFCQELKENWFKVSRRIGEVVDYQSRSMIRPKPNNLNLRLLSMKSYNREQNANLLLLDKSFGKKYFVHADIANYYPSIYTHSLSWALVGHIEAKKNRCDSSLWYNRLDIRLRAMKRNETVGIAIGPDTSGIVSELILSRIDKKLANYQYLRYIDDYKCYCSSQAEAESFILLLSRELENYNLRLNTKKTVIKELPLQYDEDWVNRLNEYCANFLNQNHYTIKELRKITGFIDLAIKLSDENPGESPYKYAVKILSKKHYDETALKYVLLYLFRICFVFPYFIDVLFDLLQNNHSKINDDLKSILKDEIEIVLNEHLPYGRSDVVLWCLFLATNYKIRIDQFEEISNRIIQERECLATLLCFRYSKQSGYELKKYYALISKLIDEQIEDEWWIYIYELFRLKPNYVACKRIKYREFYLQLARNKITFFNKANYHFRKRLKHREDSYSSY